MSENSEGCHTTPKGVEVILWHSRSVSKHLTGADEHTGVIEHPFLKFNTHHKGCQKTPKGVRLHHRVSKLFYSTLGVLVNTSQELVNTLLVSLNTPSSGASN